LQKISENKQIERIPKQFKNIQVNFCKKPNCPNFGIPAKQPDPGNKQVRGDNYKIVRTHRGVIALKCKFCEEASPVKSNIGIIEEVNRISSYLYPSESCCPVELCQNHNLSVTRYPEHYQKFGTTKHGSPRYRCKKCGKVFSVKIQSTLRQRRKDVNEMIFSLLVNKSPINRIKEVVGVSEKTIYDKINFIHKQCLKFSGEMEIKLLNGEVSPRRMYVGTDRQDHIVNWANRTDKRNTKISAVVSADNTTGYVLATNINFDPDAEPIEVEQQAEQVGDNQKKEPYRHFARFWLKKDYAEAILRSLNRRIQGSQSGINEAIKDTYDEASDRVNIEEREPPKLNRAPDKGMLIHEQYALYAHFFLIEKLTRHTEKVRFFLDQDSGIRAACLSAFVERIKNRTTDVFYVRINKDMTVDEKRRYIGEAKKRFNEKSKKFPDLEKYEVILSLIQEELDRMKEIGQWKDRWMHHPLPDMSEPEKAICYLTDMSDYDQEHLAWLYNKASLHAVDRFFMQVRRRSSLLERAISTPSSATRRWYGYNAYRPEMVQKMLDILRTYYNYVFVGKDKKTAAMRIGLALEAIKIKKILEY
jgi:transposase-like protein